LTEQVGRVREVIDGAGSWSLALLVVDPNWSPMNWVTTSLLSMATAWTAACLAKASAVALA
jgi:hypothetical protein